MALKRGNTERSRRKGELAKVRWWHRKFFTVKTGEGGAGGQLDGAGGWSQGRWGALGSLERHSPALESLV